MSAPGPSLHRIAEQLRKRRIKSADNARLITMEPRQPNRFEKNTNI